MNEQNEKWLNLLQCAKIDPVPEIKDGEITQVIVNNNLNAWRIGIQLEELISPKLLFKIINGIKSHLIDDVGIKHITFEWNYQKPFTDIDLISNYYNLAIEESCKKSQRVGPLKIYTTKFNNSGVDIYVATKVDERIVEEALFFVRHFLLELGLDKIIIKTHISKDEISIREMRKREIELRNKVAEVKALERHKTQQYQQKVEDSTLKYKSKKVYNPLKKDIKDLPVSNMDLATFTQLNQTDIVEITGILVNIELKRPRDYYLFEGIITDYEDSISIKRFYRQNERKFFEQDIKIGQRVTVKGTIQYDKFSRDIVIMANQLELTGEDATSFRFDEAPKKRVELHAHSKMSTLDSVLDIKAYVKQAKIWDHKSIAITDHANCHILPEFFSEAKKAGLKPIAGVEGYFIDENSYRIALTDESIPFENQTFVVFDIETTGFSANFHDIIEIGAVKIRNGFVLDNFLSFVQPTRLISSKITEITGITNDDVANAPTIEKVLPQFLEFIKDTILVAHNATFDTSHIYANMKKQGIFEKEYPCLDTLQLARVLYNERIKRFNLAAVAKELKVELVEHHRALSDAKTTSNIFLKMLGDLADLGITNYGDVNQIINQEQAFKFVIPTHLNILVKNKTGLKNFYRIISDSHTTHFHKEPRILKSVLSKYREGLLIGSGCVNGEIFKTAFEKEYDELLAKISFYDYLEVQPPECYSHLVEESGEAITYEFIKTTIKTIIKAGNELGIPVVATGDVHQLNETDSIYRKIYIGVARPGGGLHELNGINEIPLMHFRTTQEMLDAFNFLPLEEAYKIVVETSNHIDKQIESFELFPSKLFTPRDDFMSKYGTPSMSEAVKDITYQNAVKQYGFYDENRIKRLPPEVENRINLELDSIIGNGFASIYYISHMLVEHSHQNGYIVGSRGSVGSSFVATLMKITEVNPLKPHYLCPNCHFSVFKPSNGYNQNIDKLSEEAKSSLLNVSVGQDLITLDCPHCQTKLIGDGVDIPFETFLGINGEKSKVPDIDLNFSGDFQERAHLFCREVFGIDNAFRAGTISTVADKTAYGYVRGYLESSGKEVREAEIKRLSAGIIGAKRTTGQHPGGIIVIPDTIDYTDIIPIQYPSDDINSSWRTSHYDYHSFEDNLLKLDILGHDDPTMIRHLMDYVIQNPSEFPFKGVEDIPMLDEGVLSIFSSKAVLNLRGHDEETLTSGTIGIPEFGTNFVREMLKDIEPKSFSDIVKVSGLSHGTDVWAGNAKNLFLGIESKDKINFSEVIACRDDIMVYLLSKKLDPKDAFLIMERVRKGKGLSEAEERIMRQHQVPNWYIESCQKIKYMFPKAHAVAYVIMALRIGWFKVYRPIYYYAAYFSRRASAFDVEVFANGRNAIRNKIQSLAKKIADKLSSNKEVLLIDELQIALEMTLRGFTFRQVDINHSAARDFVIADDHVSLYLPFNAVENLGDVAAASIVEARSEYPFTSLKDVQRRTKLTKNTFNRLKVLGAFNDLPEEDENSLF